MKRITIDRIHSERSVTLSMGQYEQLVGLLVVQLGTAQDMIHNIEQSDRDYISYTEEETALKNIIDTLQTQTGHEWYKI